MALAYPLSLPCVPGFRSVEVLPVMSQGVQESPFSFRHKVYDWSGAKRVVNLELPPMRREHAMDWQGWFAALNGMVGTFCLSSSVAFGIRGWGAAGGEPVVNGGGQTGTTLQSSGWKSGISGLLLRGDWISIDDNLYQITEDVDSDDDGKADLQIWPALRGHDNRTPIEAREPRGLFRLTAPVPASWNIARIADGLTFQATEVL